MLVFERSLAADQGDQLVSEQALDSATELLYDSILACRDSLEVKVIRQSGHTESLCIAQFVQHFSIPAERLGRDATFVQTCSSDMSGFDENDLHSPFCSKEGGFITARPCTYDDDLHITCLYI